MPNRQSRWRYVEVKEKSKFGTFNKRKIVCRHCVGPWKHEQDMLEISRKIRIAAGHEKDETIWPKNVNSMNNISLLKQTVNFPQIKIYDDLVLKPYQKEISTLIEKENFHGTNIITANDQADAFAGAIGMFGKTEKPY